MAPTDHNQPLLLLLATQATEFSLDDLSTEAEEQYTGALLDFLGVWLAGRDAATAAIFSQPLPGQEGPGVLTTAGAIAAAAHALEMDDVHADVPGWHPSVSIVPPLLAGGPIWQLHGRDIFEGLIVGYEVGARIGAAMGPKHRRLGFHATGTVGAIASAAAVARARKHPPVQFAQTLGLATSMAAGTFGILAGAPGSKVLHAAHAAMAGLWAALLSESGLTGPERALEADGGFFDAFAAGDFDGARLKRRFGSPWEITRQLVKLHPCCAHIYGAIDAAWSLQQRSPESLRSADQITVTTYDIAAKLDGPSPRTAAEARFSVPWCVAATLLMQPAGGILGSDAFEEVTLNRRDIQDLASRVQVVPDLAASDDFPSTRTTCVSVGEARECVDYPRGSPENPVSRGDLLSKFSRLTEPTLGPDLSADLANLVERITETSNWVAEVNALIDS